MSTTLTSAQLTTLKAGIAADPTAAAFPHTSDGNFDCAKYLNTVANPVLSLWREDCTPAQLVAAANWANFALLTVEKQNVLFAMLLANPIDSTQASVRTGFGQVFSGTDLTTLSAAAQRNSTKFEALYASASGTANVSTLYGYQVTGGDVQAALAS